LRHADSLFFFTRYPSINPRVVLTLIELRSGLVSEPPATIIEEQDPLRLSTVGFEAELEELSRDLTRAYYTFLRQNTPLPSSQRPSLQTPLADGSYWNLPRSTNAATYALVSAMGKVMDASEMSILVDRHHQAGFRQTYLGLFPDDDPLDGTNRINILDPPPIDLLQFPFPVGEAWRFNGVHDWAGVNGGSDQSSIDLSPGWPF
jgi:LasA protease